MVPGATELRGPSAFKHAYCGKTVGHPFHWRTAKRAATTLYQASPRDAGQRLRSRGSGRPQLGGAHLPRKCRSPYRVYKGPLSVIRFTVIDASTLVDSSPATAVSTLCYLA